MMDKPHNNRSRGEETVKRDNRRIKRLFIGGCIIALFGLLAPAALTNAIVLTILSPFGGSEIGTGNGGRIIIVLIGFFTACSALFFALIMRESRAPKMVSADPIEGELPFYLVMQFETFRTEEDIFLPNEEKMVNSIEDWLRSSSVFLGDESGKKVLIELKYLPAKSIQYGLGVDLTLFLKVAIYVDGVEVTNSVVEVCELRPDGFWARFNHGMADTFKRLNEKLFIKSTDIIEQWIKVEFTKL